jgi:catechol 2,3-dioxygenase-like lactoylglutathione lyase family enzyme
MIHHLGVFASDFEASRAFFAAALQALSIVAGYETDDICEFWHSESRAAVDAFFEAAVSTGGAERYAPRHWPRYRAYCAFVTDPDGNNIEAVLKEA